MIPGWSSTLVPEFFLERLLATSDRTTDAAQAAASIKTWRRLTGRLGPASSVRTIHETATLPLLDLLGAGSPRLVAASGSQITAVSTAGDRAIAVVTIGWGERLGTARPAALAAAAAASARWAVVFNGTHVRVADARHLYGRLHADVELAAAANHAATACALSMLCREALTPGTRGSALDDLVALARAASVDVCRALRAGVLVAASEVASALLPRRSVEAAVAFEQALTLVYRVLFLLFAEARGLVPMWHPVYRTSYSIDALRSAAERSSRAPGLWDGLKAISRLAHAGCALGELRVAPFNGRLFSPARTPLVDRPDLDDDAARRAVVAMTTTSQAGRRSPIPYRDLGVEELGAVYETLLDYEPRLVPHGRARARLTLERGSDRRKSTGSFYTPRAIAEYLVRRTLGPLVSGRTPDTLLRLRVLDPAMGSGAFLVAACRFLAGAYERALIASGDRHASDIDDRERASIRRLVAERCLYGVDLNPMAVQLARLSLWLATLAADRPLTFLDHHLATGNSLVGAWLSAVRRPPAARGRAADRPLPLFDGDQLRAAAVEALPTRFRLERDPGDTLDQVRAKERALESLGRRGSAVWRWKQVANAWSARWFTAASASAALSTAFGALTDALLTDRVELLPTTVGRLASVAAEAAVSHRFFHWELEFPEVFFSESGARDPDGGFDAVLGNPPWDVVRADGGDDCARHRGSGDDVVRFTRESGFYPAQSHGHANQYQMFVERAIALAKPGGRLGLIVPAGLAIDSGSAALRRHLLASCAIDGLVGFRNQQAIFPIHRSVRFLVLTASRGSATESVPCRFGERDASVLDAIDDGPAQFPVVLSMDLLRRLSPRDLAIPELRTASDVSIVERAAALHPPLGSPDSWGARFGRELNASDDRHAFHERPSGLPVVEGKHVDAFRVVLDGVRHHIAAADARRLLPGSPFTRPRLCYRDVAGASNRTTFIAAILPAGTVSTHTVFCLRSLIDDRGQHFLCALFNSFLVNYLVRLRVGTHVRTDLVESLPIPRRETAGAAFEDLVQLSRALRTGDDLPARARLNGVVARLYQLSADEFRHVLDTFPLVPPAEREAALSAYRRL